MTVWCKGLFSRLTRHSGSRLFGGHFRPEGSKRALWVGIGYFLPKIIIVSSESPAQSSLGDSATALRSRRLPFHLRALALGTSLFVKLQVRPLIHSEREVGMAVVSGRMRARVPPRSCVAPRPTSYGPARRGAALLCWGLSRRGAMRLCGERLGSVGMGVGRAGGWVS